jgi:hypothetical protein
MNDGFVGLFVGVEGPNEMMECTFTFAAIYLYPAPHAVNAYHVTMCAVCRPDRK